LRKRTRVVVAFPGTPDHTTLFALRFAARGDFDCFRAVFGLLAKIVIRFTLKQLAQGSTDAGIIVGD